MAEPTEQSEVRRVCTRPDDQQAPGIGWSVLRKIQAAMLSIGMALGAIYVAARIEGYYSSRSAIERFDSVEPAATTDEISQDNTAAAKPNSNNGAQDTEWDFNGWGEARIRAYVDAAKRAGGDPLALLQIPKIQLQAPVFDGTDSLTLNHAVGRIAGTAKPGEAGNVGLAGHRDGFFRGLKDIQPGDEIDLKRHGGTDVYIVDRIQIVNPRDVSVLQDQDRSALTLVTCYPFYFVGSAPKRYVVAAFLKQHSMAGTTATDARLNNQTLNPTQEEQ
jgi:sortase A